MGSRNARMTHALLKGLGNSECAIIGIPFSRSFSQLLEWLKDSAIGFGLAHSVPSVLCREPVIGEEDGDSVLHSYL